MTHSSETQDAIAAADRRFEAAFNRGDAAAVASLYTENGQFLQPHGEPAKGRAAIQTVFQGLMDMGVRTIRLETLEVESYGDTASEIGTYALEADDGQLLDRGKFLVLWKKQADQWRLHRDMINSSLPAPG